MKPAPRWNPAEYSSKRTREMDQTKPMDLHPTVDYPQSDQQETVTRDAAVPDSSREKDSETMPTSQDGRYRCIEKIGGGGMGIVYRAERLFKDATGKEQERESVIIKTLKPSTIQGREDRFIREFEALRSVTHSKYLTTLLDLVKLDTGEMGIVMKDWGEGAKDLDVLFKEREHLSQQDLASIGAQLSTALQALHEEGFVHRDMKPANVLIKRTATGAPYVNLIDMGVAGILEDIPKENTRGDSQANSRESNMAEPADPALTAEGEFVGTWQYVDPYVVGGKKPDVMSDLYGLGSLLYKARTGHVPIPFSEERFGNYTKYLFEKTKEKPPSLHEVMGGSRETLFEKIVTQLVQPDPEDRKKLDLGDEVIPLDSAEHVAEAFKRAEKEEEQFLERARSVIRRRKSGN